MTEKVTPVDTLFVHWLQSVMQERDWMNKDVADAAGVTPAAVTGWLKGARPGPAPIIQLAMSADIPAEDLFKIIHVT